jgi:membrane protein required for colicin V production
MPELSYFHLFKKLIMNYIDIIILIILAVAMVRGFINGLVKEVASLAALILGIWGAIRFSSFTAAKLYDYFDMTGKYVGIIAFLVTFALIAIAIHFIGMLVDKLLEAVALGFINKLLGILFGGLKAVLVLSVVFVILDSINARKQFLPKDKIDQSMLYKPISDIAPAIFPIIGENGPFHSFERFKKKPDKI